VDALAEAQGIVGLFGGEFGFGKARLPVFDGADGLRLHLANHLIGVVGHAGVAQQKVKNGILRQWLIEGNTLGVVGVPLGLAPPQPRHHLAAIDLATGTNQRVAAVEL